ncbi:MAG: flavin oxidoreductase [Cytophagales bacterium]|nr:MAG: flavin oxidoreductase [Cytophagales bacterium]
MIKKTKTLNENDFIQMEQRYRATFFNSIGGFKSLTLVGTINKKKQTNLAVVSSVFHIGANPPLIGMIFRPDSVERHTLENILETGQYTFNHVNENIFKQAHQTSARYPREISEFDACGLSPWYSEGLIAPYVEESNIKLGITFAEKIDLKINGTVMLLGQIKEVIVPENCLSTDGFVDLEKAETLTVSGLDAYHSTSFITRLPYAKP